MYAKIDSHMRNAVFELLRETRNDLVSWQLNATFSIVPGIVTMGRVEWRSKIVKLFRNISFNGVLH